MSRTHLHILARRSRSLTKEAVADQRSRAEKGQPPDFSTAPSSVDPVRFERYGNRRNDIAKAKRRVARADRKNQNRNTRTDPDRSVPDGKKKRTT